MVITFGTVAITEHLCHNHDDYIERLCFYLPDHGQHNTSTGDVNDSDRLRVIQTATSVASEYVTASAVAR